MPLVTACKGNVFNHVRSGLLLLRAWPFYFSRVARRLCHSVELPPVGRPGNCRRLSGHVDRPGALPWMSTRSPSPTPAERFSLDDNSIDLSITAPRYESTSETHLAVSPARGPTLHADSRPGAEDQAGVQIAPPRVAGPRQRRFEFDAQVIRDTVVRKFRSIDRHDLADPIDNCHRDAVYKRCTGCLSVKKFFNRCERFYCPICAARLARDRRESVEWWSKCIRQPKHVVLTVKSVEKLTKDYVRKLKDDFRKLRRQAWAADGERWQIVPDPIESRRPGGMIRGRKMTAAERKRWKGPAVFAQSTMWRGGYWSIDATWHRDIEQGHTYTSNGQKLIAEEPIKRGWHIHFHIIVDADFVNQDRLSTEWAKLRGQQMSVVRVYDVEGRNYTAEACRYVVDGIQLAEWPAEKLAELGDALSEERCFDTFGSLYKQRAEWSKVKEEIHADRQVCPCGCSRWEIFDSNEWEWQQAKSSLSPPVAPRQAPPASHPEFFDPAAFRPVFV